MSDHESLSPDQLEHVAGGCAHRTHSSNRNSSGGGGGGGLFGWLDDLYQSIVFHFGGHRGGDKLAEGLYGKHATHRDRARAHTAMHKFLVDGHKLPKGVPNLFG